MDWQTWDMRGGARLNVRAAEVCAPWLEWPIMEAVLSQQRTVLAVAASAVGIAASWLTTSPFGLLAPMAALFLLAYGRTIRLLYAASVIGLVGALLFAAVYADATRDVAMMWAAFFSVALCIGAIVAAGVSASSGDVPAQGAPPVGTSTGVSKRLTEAIRATSGEKVAADVSPSLSVIHPDDRAAAAHAAARAFWTGVPQITRYRSLQADGSYRWTETRSEPGYSVSVDIDDLVTEREPSPTAASNPSDENEAIRSAKVIEELFGNGWALDAEGRWIYLHPFAQNSLGVTLEDLNASLKEGHTAWKRLLHPDDYDRIAAAWRHCLQTGDHFNVEFRFRRATGIYVWARTAARPARDSHGRITGWFGIALDIDVYKKTVAALRDRGRELSQLVDMVPSHLWRLKPDGEPVFFNKRMVDFLGVDVSDADKPGMSRLDVVIEAVIHPDDKAAFRNALNHCLATGDSFAMRYRLRRADGVYHWMSSRAEPMRDEGGHIVQWYGLCHDVDDQMHAEETVRQSERRLQQLVETLPAMIYCATPGGEPTYRSRQLREFLGFGLDDKDEEGRPRLAVTLDAVIHPDDLAAVKERYSHSLSTGEPYALRHRLRRFDGECRWVETRAAAMRNAEGAIVQWNGICLDIEDQVRAQEELRLAQETLARASQAASLAELSASIAHEVNQPLAAVVANSYACQRWLKTDPPNLDRAQITVERIIRDANAAAEVVSRIRALFRQTVEARSCSTLDPIIADVRRWVADLAAKHGVTIETQVDADLPSIALDRVLIQQVLINLMRNAVEAMEASAGARILSVRARRNGDVVQVEVKDTGPGIQHPEKVFNAFFTTKESGMGMGLAISRSIVESHGGRLWAEGNEGGGAAFIFTLPIETSDAS
jgi:PAS domain S-box-containing protein